MHALQAAAGMLHATAFQKLAREIVLYVSLHGHVQHECLGINHLSALAFELLLICYCDVRVHVLLKNRITVKVHSAGCIRLLPAAMKLIAAFKKQHLMLALCFG